MKKSLIPYDTTGYFNTAVTDYIKGAEQLKPFYIYAPRLDSFPEIIKKRNEFPIDRNTLYEVLTKQYQPFHKSGKADAVADNILLLKESKTFTVVTAHQPNLFLGPLYLIYKIISAIKLSRNLNSVFPQFHFVPVYWLGGEDHDKDELNNINLFSKKIAWNTTQEGAFGRMDTRSLDSVIDEIRSVLGNSEEASRCIELLEDCYLKENTIGAATKKMLYHFFSADGLVIADGDDVELKKLLAPLIIKELFDQFSYTPVMKCTEAFSKNYHSQVTPREINLFYVMDGIRQRIIKEGNQWKVLNTTITFLKDELRKEVEEHAERFSPNVILRPVYEEMILPNVAFIGGGAEVTYWMQLKALFEVAGVAFPMLLLRNSVLWIDSSNASRMQKLKVSPTEIFQSADKLVNKYLQAQSGDYIMLDAEKQQLKKLMDDTSERVIQVDASLKGAVEAEKVKMHKSLESLEDKLKKSAKKKEEVSIQQLQTVKEKLFPSAGLQERFDNFLSYYLKYGDLFFEELKQQLEPMEQQFTIILEE